MKPTEWQGSDGTCPGDSGGPALDTQGRVMGVLSEAQPSPSPSVYGDVSSWKDLIIDTAKKAAEAGGYEPPFWVTTSSSTPPPEPRAAWVAPGAPEAANAGLPCSSTDPAAAATSASPRAAPTASGTCVAA
ncbi:MAG: trypsin-like serine protease [Polyangiaceae bacterium]